MPAGASRELSESDYYRQLAENLSDLILATDLELNLTYVSPSAESVLGLPATTFQQVYEKNRRRGHAQEIAKLEVFMREELEQIKQGISADDFSALALRELILYQRDGSPLWLEVHTSPLRNDRGKVVGMLCICRDISVRKSAEESQALAAKVFENSLTGIYIVDARGKIVRVNRAFSRITGFQVEEAVGKSLELMGVKSFSKTISRSIRDSLKRKDYWEGEIRHRHKDGRVFPAWVAMTVLRDADGKVRNTISTFTDITEKKNSEVKIQRLAYFDPLTGLPNRTLFNDRLGQALNRAKRSQEEVGLLFLDLDRFKAINDSLGHALGDELLQQVALRLRDCVRSEDTVARMGGDEFTVILAGLADKQHAITAAAHVAEKIHVSLAKPFRIRDREVFTSASTGIAFFPSDGKNPKSLLQNADTAMYHAKSAGKDNYQFYTSAMNVRALERLEIENALHQAIHKSEFELYFQPIWRADDGEAVAVESLVRWRHPQEGMVLPSRFIEIAEESGLIKPLGAWVLRKSCEQLAAWQREGIPIERMSVNVSAKQFIEGYILQTLREAIDSSGVDASALELELTESALMQDHQYSVDVLTEMKQLGVRISIDDFGTGYSSLNYLKRFPIDTIKVDRSFIEGLPSAEDERIVQAIVALAHSLGITVVAEGIENQGQLEFVRSLGCEEVQGFLLGQPQAPKQVNFWQH